MMFPTTAPDLFFYFFSILAIGLALFGVVLGKNPISAAFSLVLIFFCLAADYVLLHAHFIAAIQILVYAGAVMVLFVFVIMLLNADEKSFDFSSHKMFRAASGVLSVFLLGLFVYAISYGTTYAEKSGFTPERIDDLGGNLQVLSQLMFSDYILPFELTSFLLLVGIVGSVALAKRKMEHQK